jgi:hypothetical protein
MNMTIILIVGWLAFIAVSYKAAEVVLKKSGNL